MYWAAGSWCLEALNKVRHHIQKKCRSDLCSHPDHLGLLGQMSSGLREPRKRVGCVFKGQDRCGQAIFCLFRNTPKYNWDILRQFMTIHDNSLQFMTILWLSVKPSVGPIRPLSVTHLECALAPSSLRANLTCFEWAWQRRGTQRRSLLQFPLCSPRCTSLYFVLWNLWDCGILDGCFDQVTWGSKGGGRKMTKAISKEEM